MNTHPESTCFGLISGLGTPSTLYYYRMLLEAYEARHMPARFFVANADFDRVLRLITANEVDLLAEYFASLIGRLKLAGAEFAALSAVMPHLCMPQLSQCSPIPVLDIVQVLRHHLSERGCHRIALLGTRVTMESKLFGRLADFDVIDLPLSDLEEVQRIYRSIQVRGAASAIEFQYLVALGQRLHESEGAQVIVVAGTDLSAVFHDGSAPFPLLDCAAAHIEAIVEQASHSTGHR